MTPSLITRLQNHPRAVPLLIIVTLLVAFAANLYGLMVGISNVLPHLLYIPIILAAFFYHRHGIPLAGLISAGYLLMVAVVHPGYIPDILSAAARAVVFVLIAAVVSRLSERVSVRETELIQAKEEWERTFDAVPDLIALIGREHQVLRVNRAMAHSLGISKEEAVGKRCYEIVHNSKTPPLHCPHAMLLKDGRQYTEEIHEDNLGGDFLVTTSPLYGADGGLVRSVHVARDITERKIMEEALRGSEERYRTIIENIQDVYFRFDKNSRIIMISPSAAHAFGYAAIGDMLGLPAPSLWKDPGAREQMFETMKGQGGSVQDWEVECVKADGTVFWASVSGHIRMDTEGQYQGSEGIIRDISQRKKMEEVLKTALKKLNMLSSITRHDILNQVMGLRTYLELSREDLAGTTFAPLIEKADGTAEAIQRQIEFTRYYKDIGVNAPVWQDAGTAIREASSQLSLETIDLQVAVAGTEIFADPLIVKVFFNLMENSLRHGGGVTRMSFSSRETETGLVITYRDNGAGISAEDKKNLFRKGFGKHTGLGLFLSREILAITGITIVENGEPEEGVQFEMTVPREGYHFRNSPRS